MVKNPINMFLADNRHSKTRNDENPWIKNEESKIVKRFIHYFYGPQDYAVTGLKA